MDSVFKSYSAGNLNYIGSYANKITSLSSAYRQPNTEVSSME